MPSPKDRRSSKLDAVGRRRRSQRVDAAGGEKAAPTLPSLPAVDTETTRRTAATQPVIARPDVGEHVRSATIRDMPAVPPPADARSAPTQPAIPRTRERSSVRLTDRSARLASEPPPRPKRARDSAAARYSIIPDRDGSQLQFLQGYVTALPSGLASYPEVRAAGHFVRALILDPLYPAPSGAGLPTDLEKLVRTPPAAGAWVPQVHASALQAALYDVHFARSGGLTAFRAWSFARQLRLLKPTAFRSVAGARDVPRLIDALRGWWSASFRGITLSVEKPTDGRVVLRITYPPRCWPTLDQTAFGEMLRAVGATIGATEVDVTSAQETERAARFELSLG